MQPRVGVYAECKTLDHQLPNKYSSYQPAKSFNAHSCMQSCHFQLNSMDIRVVAVTTGGQKREWAVSNLFIYLLHFWQGCHGDTTRGHTNGVDGVDENTLYAHCNTCGGGVTNFNRRFQMNFDLNWGSPFMECVCEHSPGRRGSVGVFMILQSGHHRCRVASHAAHNNNDLFQAKVAAPKQLILFSPSQERWNQKRLLLTTRHFSSWELFSQTLCQWQ